MPFSIPTSTRFRPAARMAFLVAALSAFPASAATRAGTPPNHTALYSSIHSFKVQAEPEYLDPEATVAAPAAKPDTQALELTEDGREAPPEKQKIAWTVDGPMRGEIKLGKWRSVDNRALGAVATFVLPKLQ